MEKIPMAGFSGMMSDVFGFFKIALATKKGLAIVAICTFVYFLSLYIVGGVKIWGLILSILAILTFLVLSWLIWFKAGGNLDDKDE